MAAAAGGQMMMDMMGAAGAGEHVDRGQLEEMEERLIEQVE